MTTLAIFTTADRVFATADSLRTGEAESYFSHYAKLAHNPIARTICAGTGYTALLDPAYRTVADAESFDVAVPLVTKALRDAAAVWGCIFDEHPYDFAGQTFCVAGWSEAAGRMVPYKFDAVSWFTPVIDTRIMRPAVDVDSELWMPSSYAEMLALSCRQAAKLAKRTPHVASASLTISSMTKCECHTLLLRDYSQLEDVTCS